jgi:hypothetical protein
LWARIADTLDGRDFFALLDGALRRLSRGRHLGVASMDLDGEVGAETMVYLFG